VVDFVWSIDDAGLGGSEMVESLQKTCRFLESRGLRATWMVVPKPNGHSLSPQWLEALEKARDAGHDLQLHGLTHEDCYEFGPPAWPATAILPSMGQEFEQGRGELMPRYTVAKLRARVDEGMRIFQEQLDIVPTVFRAPCGAISRAMFQALDQVGIRFHTAMYISGTGYEHLAHNSGLLEPVWTDTIPHRPFRWYSGIIEVPLLNEYTWRGSGQRSAEFVELARRDVDRIAGESPVAVLLMHTHGIADDYDHAFRIIDAVVEQVARHPGATFTTLGRLVAAGGLVAAATTDGPDILSV
jgi:peptidoglycan/xylan/chitin deacetylase (PgdA/CDA1 family)